MISSLQNLETSSSVTYPDYFDVGIQRALWLLLVISAPKRITWQRQRHIEGQFVIPSDRDGNNGHLI